MPDLNRFLSEVFPPYKGSFLSRYGAWWHGGDQNRWVVTVDREIAGYCAVIPGRVLVEGEIQPAIWWVDLVISSRFRGRGLQSIFDTRIREMDILKLGFPNELAANIHRKHQWGVREDLAVLMLPLQPTHIRRVWDASGRKGFLLKAAAQVLQPWAALRRFRSARYQPRTARRLETASPQILAEIFERWLHTAQAHHINTTVRDGDYLQWRYFDSPFYAEHAFYIAGPQEAPTHYLIARHLQRGAQKITRILDLFGDFEQPEVLSDLVQLAVQDAIERGASQVTLLVSLPELASRLRSLGFFLKAPTRFCWYSASEAIMHCLAGPIYWTLADSDNDELA